MYSHYVMNSSGRQMREFPRHFTHVTICTNNFLICCYVVLMATQRVYAGGEDSEGVEDGSDSADMEEER